MSTATSQKPLQPSLVGVAPGYTGPEHLRDGIFSALKAASCLYWWFGFIILTTTAERLEVHHMMLRNARVQAWTT